jgi:hypothetical protein
MTTDQRVAPAGLVAGRVADLLRQLATLVEAEPVLADHVAAQILAGAADRIDDMDQALAASSIGHALRELREQVDEPPLPISPVDLEAMVLAHGDADRELHEAVQQMVAAVPRDGTTPALAAARCRLDGAAAAFWPEEAAR